MGSRLLLMLRTMALGALLVCLMITGITVTFVGLGNGSDLGVCLGVAALVGAVAVLTAMVVVADRRR